MFIVGILSWWYGAGWLQQVGKLRERLASMVDYFSITLLIKSLFSPFRQISAGQVGGPIGVRWRAFVDRLVSRCIGAIVRSMIIMLGCVAIVSILTFGAVGLVIWAVIPLLPLIGAVAAAIGWTPSWM